MKNIITRTSGGIPCKEAKLEILSLTYVDYRTVKTIEEAKLFRWYDNWISTGTNHREDKKRQQICRDILREDTPVYTIETDGIMDIVRLQNKYGDIIIKGSGYKEIKTELEIYDNYRE